MAVRRIRLMMLAGCMGVATGIQVLAGSPGEANFAGRNGHLVVAIGGPSQTSHLWSWLPNRTDGLQLTDGDVRDCCASYSASGQRIAFTRDPTPADFSVLGSEVWVMNADGSEERQVTSLNGWAVFPKFSPIEPRVVFQFTRAEGGNTHDIYSIGLDGTAQRRLTASARWHDSHPAFAPGGRHLLWLREERRDESNRSQLWIMRRDGTQKRRLVSTDFGYLSGADWSPGGQLIAYTHLIRGRLTIVRTDGTVVRRIYHRGVDGAPIVWSPNGRWIAFTWFTKRRGSFVRAVSVDGKRTRDLPTFWGDAPLRTGIGWQPNPI